ncbi:MAG TPA: hypothetical protein VJT67_07105, partial [Longimicrobiaceae bacterium]|nr:hypothetical protein [Longimicrobiaceae bacterium]
MSTHRAASAGRSSREGTPDLLLLLRTLAFWSACFLVLHVPLVMALAAGASAALIVVGRRMGPPAEVQGAAKAVPKRIKVVIKRPPLDFSDAPAAPGGKKAQPKLPGREGSRAGT